MVCEQKFTLFTSPMTILVIGNKYGGEKKWKNKCE
jgi:hypothetical protein